MLRISLTPVFTADSPFSLIIAYLPTSLYDIDLYVIDLFTHYCFLPAINYIQNPSTYTPLYVSLFWIHPTTYHLMKQIQ